MENAFFLKGVELFLGFKIPVYDTLGFYCVKALSAIICFYIIDDLLASTGRNYIAIGEERGIYSFVVASFGSLNE